VGATPAAGGGPPVDELGVARAVLRAARRVPGVAAVSPGRFAAAATYGAGESVRGVAVQRVAGALAVEVHLCAVYARALVLPALADRVRRAVRDAVGGLGAAPLRRIDVAFDDLQVGEDPAGAERVNG
jgi:hypothetical protein